MLSFGNNKLVIGMVHLLPTNGYKGFTSKEDILRRALEDLQVLEENGIDAIIIENNYDLPHKIKVGKETLEVMDQVIKELRKKTRLPLGINVLWNDFEASLSLANKHNCEFIRVPVFNDHVKTSFGEIKGCPEKIIEFRKKISAEHISILADIQVKHAELLNKRPLTESAKEAIEKGADGLIITGKWTGDFPTLKEVMEVKKMGGDTPVIVGSGVDKDNVKSFFKYSDAVIVSTSLKDGEKKSPEEERNIKPYTAKIDPSKLKEFMLSARG